jgi:uncharacterized protein (TIGR03790 family)
MLRLMRTCFPLILLLLSGSIPPAAGAPAPDSVAVLYNSAVPESRKLAEFYRDARAIPEDHLIGLDMPAERDITREDYEQRIAGPLRDEFDRRGWWKRSRDTNGMIVPYSNRIHVLVTMRGVPLRIKQAANTARDEPLIAKNPNDPVAIRNDAAVDSELAMFGVENLPAAGALRNLYHQSNVAYGEADIPSQLLTARIDASSHAICERMIRDAVEAEKTGLWGMAYVDIANKFPQGDAWLENVVKANLKSGIPTVVDRFNQTLPKNYPMGEAAMYHGWYDYHVSGPFLNPQFRFRRGAVAMHLHSFSAEQLGNAGKNWCAPLLARGAAVTVGNVHEPYLHLTHDYGLLHERLLDGFSWVEACWMAMPVTSWQGIVLGDPLYRPFLHLSGSGVLRKEDRYFRALRAAMMQWPSDPETRYIRFESATRSTHSGYFAEAAGLDMLESGQRSRALAMFQLAKNTFANSADKMRQDFHIAASDRIAGRNDIALRALRDAQMRYQAVAEAAALADWIQILDPPPAPRKPAEAGGQPRR